MAICSVDNLQLPDAVMTKCSHCGAVMCVRHLKQHHAEVKMTFVTIPALMGVKK